MIRELAVAIFLTSLVLFLPVFAEENCEVAYPLFGIVECISDYAKDAPPKYDQKEFAIIEDSEDIINFQCSGHCEIDQKLDIKVYCGFAQIAGWGIYKNGDVISTSDWKDSAEYPLRFFDGDSITVKASCNFIYDIKTSSYVKFSLWEKYLWEELPQQGKEKNPNTPGCISQDLVEKYYPSSLSSQYSAPEYWVTDKDGENKQYLSTETNGEELRNMDNFPTNMMIGETKSFFYRWESVSNINKLYNKDGNLGGYCGGSGGNRKLFEYKKVETLSESCYLIPTKISKTVDCCYDTDCPGELACDPTTYTCSENKPCNSDLECPQDSCSDNIETNWLCDITKPWYPKSGTCVKSTKQVLCCFDKDCPADKYCSRAEGCKDKYVLIDCPTGMCCAPGGDYKEKACPSNLKCCPTSDPLLGECKELCEPPPETASTESRQTSESVFPTTPVTQTFSGTGMNISLISGFVGVALLIVAVVLLMYFTVIRKVRKPTSLPEKNGVGKSQAGFCPYCGSSIGADDVFCPECGGKIE